MSGTVNNRVAILGVGGGGGTIVAELAAGGNLPAAVELAVADADQGALDQSGRVLQIALGHDWTKQAGCGGNATLGEKAATASIADLRAFVEGASLVIVVAGLGGGTGSGGCRVVGRLLRQMNVMNLFVVSMPFAFEGNWRCHQAEKDLEGLRGVTDTVMAIPNDLLFTSLPADTPIVRAFEAANSILADGICGLSRLTRAEGVLTVDFAALRNMLKEKPALCALGVGHGTGEQRLLEVVKDFFACPLIGGPETLAQADAAVLSLVGGADLSVGDIQTCLSSLQQYFPLAAKVLVGAYADPALQDEVQLTGLVCRFATQGSEPNRAPDAPVPGAEKPRTRKHAKKVSASAETQGELPLLEQALGIFSGSTPTPWRGENLDVPTFQRHGVAVDAGD